MARMLIPRHLPYAAPLALFVLGVLASCAAANIPAPVVKTNTVRFTAQGSPANGTLATTVTYTDNDATATASSARTIRLERGFTFRLSTCVAYHLNATMPVSRCAERIIDTVSSKATVYAHPPRVTLRRQPRPITQPWGYFTVYTEVRFEGHAGLLNAHSWPDNGLQGAGIAVAAQGHETGTLPPNSLVTLEDAFTGAVNSGEADSICTNTPATSNGSALPAGVSASHPAFAGAPSYYEVGLPTGAYVGQPPRGVMLVLHSGGWNIAGVGGAEVMRPDADRWRDRGWETVNFANSSCGRSVADVLWFYDRARAWFGVTAKLCTLGSSAGGHLALLIGAYRPGLYCAVSMGAPTNLRVIQSEFAYDAASGLYSRTLGGRWVHNLAAAAFGEENLDDYSPAAQASATLQSTRVLQAFSAHDPTIPFEQAADLADAMRAANPAAYVDNVQLEAGAMPFAHAGVSEAALGDFYAHEERLVAPVSSPTVALGKR